MINKKEFEEKLRSIQENVSAVTYESVSQYTDDKKYIMIMMELHSNKMAIVYISDLIRQKEMRILQIKADLYANDQVKGSNEKAREASVFPHIMDIQMEIDFLQKYLDSAKASEAITTLAEKFYVKERFYFQDIGKLIGQSIIETISQGGDSHLDDPDDEEE